MEPPELAGVARTVFLDTIAGTDAKHFQPSDVPMLVAYCNAVGPGAQ